MNYPQGADQNQHIRISSFRNEDPLRNISVRIRSEIYDVPMIRMDDFGILNKCPTINDSEMKKIDENVKKLQEFKDKYRV